MVQPILRLEVGPDGLVTVVIIKCKNK